jgi:hypothetical protein
MGRLKKFLLARLKPHTVRFLGLQLLIGGLIAEAIVLVAMEAGLHERLLSALFTIAIAIGVWLEEVGGHAIAVAEGTPRWLLLEPNVDRLPERLRPFAGTAFDLGFGGKEQRDQIYLVSLLEPALAIAGWKQVDWQWDLGRAESFSTHLSPRMYGKVGVSDVVVEAAMYGNEIAAADALANILNEIGIAASRGFADNTNANRNAVHILIGPKH